MYSLIQRFEVISTVYSHIYLIEKAVMLTTWCFPAPPDGFQKFLPADFIFLSYINKNKKKPDIYTYYKFYYNNREICVLNYCNSCKQQIEHVYSNCKQRNKNEPKLISVLIVIFHFSI